VAKLGSTLAVAAWVATMSSAAAGAAQRLDLESIRVDARSRHPTLASAQAALEAAEAYLKQQRLLEDPEASFESGRAESGGVSGAEWSLEVSQRLPWPGSRRGRIRSAEAGVERARSEGATVAALLDYEVGRLWTDAVLAQRTAEVASQGETIAEQLVALIERRVEAGEAPPVEALRARTEWFARRRMALGSDRRAASTRQALDIVCNRSLGPDFELVGTLESPRPLPPLEVLVERLREASPSLRSRQASVAEAEARQAVAAWSYGPDLAVSLSRESELDKEATSAGVALSLPLWNRKRAATAAASADLARSRAELDAWALDLELELADAVADYRVASQTLSLFDAGWHAAARETLEIVGFSFEHGESSLLDLLDAQRSALEVGLVEAEARANLTRARLRIEHLLGEPLDEDSSNAND
jgi:cobalt-zinc-cadmium efflux system outer membrane protein